MAHPAAFGSRIWTHWKGGIGKGYLFFHAFRYLFYTSNSPNDLFRGAFVSFGSQVKLKFTHSAASSLSKSLAWVLVLPGRDSWLYQSPQMYNGLLTIPVSPFQRQSGLWAQCTCHANLQFLLVREILTDIKPTRFFRQYSLVSWFGVIFRETKFSRRHWRELSDAPPLLPSQRAWPSALLRTLP